MQQGPDPYRNGVHISINANKKLCPVSSMFQFVQMRISQGANMSDPLFVDFNGVVLTRHQFINYVHHLLCRLGVNTWGLVHKKIANLRLRHGLREVYVC